MPATAEKNAARYDIDGFLKLIGDVPLWIAAMVVFFRGVTAQGEMVDA